MIVKKKRSTKKISRKVMKSRKVMRGGNFSPPANRYSGNIYKQASKGKWSLNSNKNSKKSLIKPTILSFGYRGTGASGMFMPSSQPNKFRQFTSSNASKATKATKFI